MKINEELKESLAVAYEGICEIMAKTDKDIYPNAFAHVDTRGMVIIYFAPLISRSISLYEGGQKIRRELDAIKKIADERAENIRLSRIAELQEELEKLGA